MGRPEMVPWYRRKHFVPDYVPTQLITVEAAGLNKRKGRRLRSFLSALRRLLTTIPRWLSTSSRKEIYLNEIDLRHFDWIRMSDTENGKSIPWNGFANDILLYDGGEVFRRQTGYAQGVPQKPEVVGDETWLFVEKLGRKYLEVVGIVNHLGGESRTDTFSPIIVIAPQMKRILCEHWQFKNLQARFANRGLELKMLSVCPLTMEVALVLKKK